MNIKFKKICDNPPSKRFEEYCNGTSGLGYEKEQYYLENYLAKKLNPKEPGLMQKAVNFSKALVKHAATGFQSVSKEEQEERMNICKACPHFNKEKTSCYLCGCHLNTKTAWNESRCPDPQGDRWEKAKKERLEKTVENL